MLSIVIVNYNVKYFAEQCLYSVQRAIAGLGAEVLLVDNNSTDESVAHLKEKFPWVIFVVNKENTGFARANNQGWKMAKGSFILFLNPDTIISEDCLTTSIGMLQQDNRLGALGIHMLDGRGCFLPESKRGFPSPAASFYKLSGLIKIFPRSRLMARYYMGWLPEKENNETDVLSGAFMMAKKEVLEKTGGFDEQFFMYGEDIDLSYRIKQAGYKNYYLGTNSIIHFKGESTKKDIGYTIVFYKAMGIFVRKHYGKKSRGFSLLMQVPIAVSGALSFARRLFRSKRQRSITRTIHTILAGDPAETKTAMEILMRKGQRKITCVTDLPEIYNTIRLQHTDEIIFCAGTLLYKHIIDCIENLSARFEYKIFAAGSKSIAGSSSKNSSGEIIVLM